jgi:hypothetical protein
MRFAVGFWLIRAEGRFVTVIAADPEEASFKVEEALEAADLDTLLDTEGVLTIEGQEHQTHWVPTGETWFEMEGVTQAWPLPGLTQAEIEEFESKFPFLK